MSILSSLPAPRNTLPTQSSTSTSYFPPEAGAKEPPRYLRRQGFVPRKQEDYGDGGAFPEIHTPQFPLDMGRPSAKAEKSQTLAVTVGSLGETNFDAVVKQGKNSNKIVYSSHQDLLPKIDEIEKEVNWLKQLLQYLLGQLSQLIPA